jgi:hypothetical protein
MGVPDIKHILTEPLWYKSLSFRGVWPVELEFQPATRPRAGLHTTELGTYSSVLALTSHQQHPEDGDGVCPGNDGQLSHLDAAVCPKGFYVKVACLKYALSLSN